VALVRHRRDAYPADLPCAISALCRRDVPSDLPGGRAVFLGAAHSCERRASRLNQEEELLAAHPNYNPIYNPNYNRDRGLYNPNYRTKYWPRLHAGNAPVGEW
jgi:hypothetical protein